jgi:hypothetical protein
MSGFPLLDSPTPPVPFLQEFTRRAEARFRLVEGKMMFGDVFLSFGDMGFRSCEYLRYWWSANATHHQPKSSHSTAQIEAPNLEYHTQSYAQIQTLDQSGLR